MASSRRAHDPVHDLSVALTRVHPELFDADWESITASVLATARQQALVVLVTQLDESTLADDILPVLPTLTSRHRVVVASVEDPSLRVLAEARGDAEEIYTAAAAEAELLTTTSLRTLCAGSVCPRCRPHRRIFPVPWPTSTSGSRSPGACERVPGPGLICQLTRTRRRPLTGCSNGRWR